MLRVDQRRSGDQVDLAGRSDVGRQHSRAHHAVAHQLHRPVAAAIDHRRARPQPGILRRTGRHAPGRLTGQVHLREQRRVQPQRIQQRPRPVAPSAVQRQRARSVGHVRAQLSAEHQPHVVLRQQHVRHPSEPLRLIFPQPHQRRQQKAGGGGIQRHVRRAQVAQLLHLRYAAPVGPDDRRAHGAKPFVQRHQPVHRSGQPHRRDRSRRQARNAQRPPDARGAGPPQPVRVLLRPAGPGNGDVVCLRGQRDGLAAPVHDQRLRAGGAQIHAHEIRHCRPSSRRALRACFGISEKPASCRFRAKNLSHTSGRQESPGAHGRFSILAGTVAGEFTSPSQPRPSTRR